MANQIRLAQAREQEIAELLTRLSERTQRFRSPQLVVIGGYALRAFLPLSRSTRDCDFAFRRQEPWLLDSIRSWLPDLQVLTLEKRDAYGFMRCLKVARAGGFAAKVSLDFMEGEVVGREADDRIRLDARFEDDAEERTIAVAGRSIDVVVPCYRDYFILKTVSARRSDIRDIAALVWKLGVPDVGSRLPEVLPDPDVFARKIKAAVIPDMQDRRFLHSWRGTFVTTEFTEEDKAAVIGQMQKLVE